MGDERRELDQAVIKLAIVHSVCELLAVLDLDALDGAESELMLDNGDEFVISVRRKGSHPVMKCGG